MPDIPKGYLRIAGYPVDSGNWTSRVDVWGNEAVLKSSSSLPVTLNQVVTVDYVSGGNITTLVSNGIVNRIEAREEGFEKTYEYTVWGKEYVGKYRLSSETGTIQPATLKLQNYMTAIGLTPTFYNLSGVTLAPNEMANQYISDIVDEICRPATIHYYFKTDGSPVFFVGTISTVSISTQLTEKERNEDLSKVYNQILVDTNYHPVNENFDLFTETVAGSYRWNKKKTWFWESEWTDWYSLVGDTSNKLVGNLSLRASSIQPRIISGTEARIDRDICNLGAFIRIPISSTLTASSLTGFFIAIGSSLNPESSYGATSVNLKVRILFGPDPLETPDEDKRYLATEVNITANTVLTWNSISLDKEAFVTKNKIKQEEMSSTTLSYVHFQIASSTVWTTALGHTPEQFTFWFDQGYFTEYASTLLIDSDSQNKYGIRELAPEELGSEPASAKSYNDLVAKGRSLLTPKPEQFYSRVEVPATLSLLTLGNAYTLSYGSTLITGMLTEIQLDVPENEMSSWIYTFSSSPEYPSRTKLYKKLERLDTEVRYLLNVSPPSRMPSEGRIFPYIIAGAVNAESGYLNAGYIYSFQAQQVGQIGSIGTIGNIGSFSANYVGNIGSIGNIGNANFQNIGNINQIGTIGNISTMNVNSIGSIGVINTIGQANFGYVGNIGNIGYIGSIDQMKVNRIDNINTIGNINYAAIVQANVQNIGNVQNMTAAYINVTNMATLGSATITNAYITNISNINTLNASNLYVSNIASIGTGYITNANITNISSLNSASIGTAYISVIQNVATLVATTANITHIGNVSDLTATQANITNISNVSNLTASTANLTNVLGVSNMSVTSASISNITGVSNFYTTNATIGNANITNISSLNSATIGSANIAIIGGVSTLTATNANINYIQNVSSLSATSANIVNITGISNLTASTANISIIQNVGTITATQANLTNVSNLVSLTASTVNATNLIASSATISNSTIGNVIATNAQLSGSIKTDKIVALTTQITIGSSGQQVYIPVPSTIVNVYGTSIHMSWGTVDTALIGTITAGSLSFTIGTVQTFYIGNASASVMNFSIGTVNNINISGVASGNQMSFSSGTIGNLNVTGIETINTISVSSATIGQLNVTGTGIIGTVSISCGTINNLTVTGVQHMDTLTVSSATITNCNITSTGLVNNLSVTSGTIVNLNVTATESVSTLSVSSGTIDVLNVTSNASMDRVSINSSTIGNLTVTSTGQITNLQVSNIGYINWLSVTTKANIGTMNVSSGTVVDLNVTSVSGIQTLSVNSATIGQMNVTGYGHIGVFDLDVGTIDSALITIGTLNYATITATSVGTAFISISTINSCTITFGTITNFTAITENVSTLNVTVKGSLSFATISAAGIGGLSVSSGTLASCTISSGQIGNLSITSSTINQLKITTPLIGTAVITADNLVFLPYDWIPNPSFEVVDSAGNLVDWQNVTRVSGGYNSSYAGVVAANNYGWANSTVPTDYGEIWRFKGYSQGSYLHYFALKVLDSLYNPIGTLTCAFASASSFTERLWQATISVSGAKFIVPGLYALLKSATFDMLSLAKDVGEINIGDGQITSPKIAADAVQTSQIHFDPLSGSDPSDSTLTLWYRNDYDQLRFGGQNGQIGIVKRYPITEFNTPPENLVFNPFFEEDIDYDGVPDYWVPPPGSKNVDWGTLSPGLRGKKCIWSKISSSGTYKEWQSICVPVRPGQKLYARCYAKADAAYTPNIGILHIAWYPLDGTTFLDEVTSTVKGLTTSWDIHEVTATVPADGTYAQNVRYAKIHLYAGNVATYTTYYDDVVLSEQRAVVPTDEVVATADAASGTSVTVPDQTWTTLLSYTVPNVDHEVLFCFASAMITDSPGVAYPICGRLYNETDNIYYPVNSSTSVQETYYMPNLASMSAVFFFTIPKNVKNKVLKFQIWHNIGSSKAFFGRATFWGHSPHAHR